MSNANIKPAIEAQLVDVPQNKVEQFFEQNFKNFKPSPTASYLKLLGG